MSDELDTQKLEEEVAKVTEEETASETTTEKTSEEEAESTRTDTSLKTEEEAEASKETKEEKPEEDEETRFDKHPRWQKLKQERDEALDRVRESDTLRQQLGDLPVEDILKLRNAGELLRKYPELADKVQKVIDEHPYGNEEVNRSLDEIRTRQQKIEDGLLLEKYDVKVDKLLAEHKVDKDIVPFVKELLENRVSLKRIKMDDIPKAFEEVMKDIEKIRRKVLASHIENKSREQEVPASPKEKGKVIATKKESAEAEDVIEELAQGLKSAGKTMIEE